MQLKKIDTIEKCLDNYNQRATGRNDSRGLGFVIRDETGRTIGVAAGYSWAGTSELKQMWIDEAYRGRGYARELLNAFVAEAARLDEQEGFQLAESPTRQFAALSTSILPTTSTEVRRKRAIRE